MPPGFGDTMTLPILFALVLAFLLTQTNPRGIEFTRRTLGALVLVVTLFLAFGAARVRAAGTTYYIDWVGGSNSNTGTSQGSPWKSAPGMQTASGCGGSTHSYTHANGDTFVFKGGTGETWPVACFELLIAHGGASGVPDYWGACVNNTDFSTAHSGRPTAVNFSPCAAGTSWPSTGWTQPKFDMGQSIPTGNNVVAVTSTFTGYTTFDDIEIANQGLHITSAGVGVAYTFSAVTGSMPGVTIENGNIHDWVTPDNVSTQTGGNQHLGAGGIYDGSDRITVDYTTIQDAGGYLFAGTTQKFVGFGGGCLNCKVISNDTMHDGWAFCFSFVQCTGNEAYNITQSSAYCVGSTTCSVNGSAPHTQVVEDDYGCFVNSVVANNYIHDNPGAGVTVYMNYSTYVYNNVMKNNANGNIKIGEPGGCHISSGEPRGYALNNTVDCTNSTTCFNTDSKAVIPGPFTLDNNVWITNGTATCINSLPNCQPITSFTNGSNNYTMGTTEANNFGFTSAAKYKPSSSDSNVTAKGTNYTSICLSGLAALCKDASGTVWFGGSYISRPTGSTAWDRGAYYGQGGVPGPPTVTITAPSAGTVSGSSVTLTMTCVPQSPSTVSSMQFTIDGFTFGAAGTSSPYSITWDSTTAANANHVIGATCTDSRAQVGTASTVTVTVSNSIPGCFISTDGAGTNPLSWTANQGFTPLTSGSQTYTVTITPNTSNQNSVFAISNAAITAYSQGAALIRFNSSGQIDVYKGSLPGYTFDNTATYTAGTAYSFTIVVNLTGGYYTVAETSPSAITIAGGTGYTFRTTADVSQLATINAVSIDDTPDTQKVCNFLPASSTSLTLSPASLAFGNVTTGSTPTLNVNASASGGTVNFSSIAVSGDPSFSCTAGCSTSSTSTNFNVTIQFAPTVAGAVVGTLTYTDSATGSPHTVPLSGTGVAATPSATPSPSALNLGNVLIYTPSGTGPTTVALVNGPVTFSSVAISGGTNPGDFTITSNTCTGSVSAPSCMAQVSVTPTTLTTETANLVFTDNAPTSNSTQTVTLQVTGITVIPVSPGPQMFVWNGSMDFFETIKGKNYPFTVPVTCNCTLDAKQTPPLSCACQ